MTLVEVLVGIAIMSIIAGATVVAIHQLLTASARANDMQVTISQVRAAEHWMTRDILTAQTIELGGEHGFPLTIQWKDITDADHEVQYRLEEKSDGSLPDLKRKYEAPNSPPASLAVASYINPDSSSIVQSEVNPRTLVVTLVATVRGHSETRVFEVTSRPEAANE